MAATAAATAAKGAAKRRASGGGGGLRTSLGMALNLLLLLAMVATNLFSFYHLTTTLTTTTVGVGGGGGADVPHHLLAQLDTIRSAISHLTHLRAEPVGDDGGGVSRRKGSPPPPPPPELVLYSKLGPIATACHAHPELLTQYMSYTPFAACPPLRPPDLTDLLLLHGCHPLPRRRCFSASPSASAATFPPADDPPASNLDLTVPQLLRLARDADALPLRLALDVAGGTGEFAARLRSTASANATVLTTTMNLGGAPNSQAAARRGVPPLHAPLQQRFPLQDGVMDLVRCGRAVNRWIPTEALEFLLFDADRVLRTGGLLWLDHFFCKGSDLGKVYTPVIKKLGYKILKWTTANKTDAGGLRNGDVYLTALLQKHPTK